MRVHVSQRLVQSRAMSENQNLRVATLALFCKSFVVAQTIHRRLCVGRKGVGVLIARRRQGVASADPPMAACGFYGAPGRHVYFHEDLLDLVSQYKHSHNDTACVLPLHATIGDTNSLPEYFAADCRFAVAWNFPVLCLE